MPGPAPKRSVLVALPDPQKSRKGNHRHHSAPPRSPSSRDDLKNAKKKHLSSTLSPRSTSRNAHQGYTSLLSPSHPPRCAEDWVKLCVLVLRGKVPISPSRTATLCVDTAHCLLQEATERLKEEKDKEEGLMRQVVDPKAELQQSLPSVATTCSATSQSKTEAKVSEEGSRETYVSRPLGTGGGRGSYSEAVDTAVQILCARAQIGLELDTLADAEVSLGLAAYAYQICTDHPLSILTYAASLYYVGRRCCDRFVQSEHFSKAVVLAKRGIKALLPFFSSATASSATVGGTFSGGGSNSGVSSSLMAGSGPSGTAATVERAASLPVGVTSADGTATNSAPLPSSFGVSSPLAGGAGGSSSFLGAPSSALLLQLSSMPPMVSTAHPISVTLPLSSSLVGMYLLRLLWVFMAAGGPLRSIQPLFVSLQEYFSHSFLWMLLRAMIETRDSGDELLLQWMVQNLERSYGEHIAVLLFSALLHRSRCRPPLPDGRDRAIALVMAAVARIELLSNGLFNTMEKTTVYQVLNEGSSPPPSSSATLPTVVPLATASGSSSVTTTPAALPSFDKRRSSLSASLRRAGSTTSIPSPPLPFHQKSTKASTPVGTSSSSWGQKTEEEKRRYRKGRASPSHRTASSSRSPPRERTSSHTPIRENAMQQGRRRSGPPNTTTNPPSPITSTRTSWGSRPNSTPPPPPLQAAALVVPFAATLTDPPPQCPLSNIERDVEAEEGAPLSIPSPGLDSISDSFYAVASDHYFSPLTPLSEPKQDSMETERGRKPTPEEVVGFPGSQTSSGRSTTSSPARETFSPRSPLAPPAACTSFSESGKKPTPSSSPFPVSPSASATTPCATDEQVPPRSPSVPATAAVASTRATPAAPEGPEVAPHPTTSSPTTPSPAFPPVHSSTEKEKEVEKRFLSMAMPQVAGESEEVEETWRHVAMYWSLAAKVACQIGCHSIALTLVEAGLTLLAGAPRLYPTAYADLLSTRVEALLCQWGERHGDALLSGTPSQPTSILMDIIGTPLGLSSLLLSMNGDWLADLTAHHMSPINGAEGHGATTGYGGPSHRAEGTGQEPRGEDRTSTFDPSSSTPPYMDHPSLTAGLTELQSLPQFLIKAIDADPSHAHAHFLLGYLKVVEALYYGVQTTQQAVLLSEANHFLALATFRSPKEPKYLYTSGCLHMFMGDPEGALNFFTSALEAEDRRTLLPFESLMFLMQR